ncbi:MAG: DUF3179 domain-containing protein [Devosiaceae bacterium]|nr:DUF3179 domain-containing protein [Devosiaceae bacterium MH13]
MPVSIAAIAMIVRRLVRLFALVPLTLAALILSPVPNGATQEGPAAAVEGTRAIEADMPLSALLGLFVARSPQQIADTLASLDRNWSDGYYAPLIEITGFTSNNRLRVAIFELLEKRSGESLGTDFHDWFQWLWNQPEAITADFDGFKSLLYRVVDPRFERYFAGRQQTAEIRLDEIRWGGVVQDGIPPLRSPLMMPAAEADYLDDSNIVFGLEINGDARAYPKRILAWHEMFTDTVGGVEVAGVYCTLCGTVIPYVTRVDGQSYTLGTSGFLYRSNKLMYDAATQSLWSTMRGVPVVGPLVGQGVVLPSLAIVTTTWGDWKRRHPDTTVLSLETGHRRDYGEGVAYRRYFATDDLMFNTPFADDRLANKQEVLGLRFAGAPEDQLAIDTAFLAANPVYRDAVGFQPVAILTDTSGANRVYDPAGVTLTDYDGEALATDSEGTAWQVAEEALIAPDGRRLERLPAHRAFWFGWHAAFPQTRLVQ